MTNATSHTNPTNPTGSVAPADGEASSRSLESRIAHVLTVGTYLAVAFLAAGSVLLLASGGSPLDVAPGLDLRRIASELASLEPAGALWLGLLLVIATPVARVAAALVGYGRQGERAMAVVAALVLIVIAAGVVAGVAGG